MTKLNRLRAMIRLYTVLIHVVPVSAGIAMFLCMAAYMHVLQVPFPFGILKINPLISLVAGLYAIAMSLWGHKPMLWFTHRRSYLRALRNHELSK